jgi:hypothetical protein
VGSSKGQPAQRRKNSQYRPAMSEKPIFYQLFNKLTPQPARPSDLKLAHWKPGINLLSARPLALGHLPVYLQLYLIQPTAAVCLLACCKFAVASGVCIHTYSTNNATGLNQRCYGIWHIARLSVSMACCR